GTEVEARRPSGARPAVGGLVGGGCETVAVVRPVAAAAGCLQEPRPGEAEHQTPGRHQPRLAPSEVLDVAQDVVAAGALEIVAESLGLTGDLIDHPGRGVLALSAQLL